ncbi:unnamed protein product [Rotaria magnacalcarata]
MMCFDPKNDDAKAEELLTNNDTKDDNYSRQNHDTRINKSFFDILGIHLHYKLLISNYIDINYKMFDPSCDEILKDLCGSGNTQNNDTTTGLEFVPNNSLPTN